MCTSTTLPLVTSLTRAAAQWFTLNQDVSTTPLAHPFSRTTHSLTCPALLTSLPRSTALICCSLALSLTPELVGKRMIRCLKTTWFCPTVRGSFTNSQARSMCPVPREYPVNRVKCEKVKAKCSFSMGHRDLHKLRPSKEYIDVFIYPSLMI